MRVEDAYFSQWSDERFVGAPPGEFKLNDALWGTFPGPATYLMEPYLITEGRIAFKKGLVSILKDLSEIKDSFENNGRIRKIERGITITLNLINTICACKDEQWRD